MPKINIKINRERKKTKPRTKQNKTHKMQNNTDVYLRKA